MHIFCVYAGLVDFCRKLCYFDVKINAQLTTVSYLVLGIGAQMLKYRPNINPIKSIRLEAYQMSTMKKRIPMFLLSLAMMVAMALPTFAAQVGPNYYSMTYRPYHSISSSNNYLNVARDSTTVSALGKPLILWETTSPSTDQKFNEVYRVVNSKAGFVLEFAADTTLAVNRETSAASSSRAILWTYQKDETSMKDSALTRIDRYGEPKFRLVYGSQTYLSYASDSNKARVTFGGSNNTSWDC